VLERGVIGDTVDAIATEIDSEAVGAVDCTHGRASGAVRGAAREPPQAMTPKGTAKESADPASAERFTWGVSM
jgi:hypothetical protein